jgi:hypothetical protein
MRFPKTLPLPVSSGINDLGVNPLRPFRVVLRYFWSHPRLFRTYAKLRHGIDIFDDSYDFLFDGFPRSGNTFGSRMLAATQNDAVKVLSNVHCPPFFLSALEMGKPACLTIRKPADAIVSWVIYKRNLPIDVVLKLYLDFYNVLLPHRERLLIIPFCLVTKNFKMVLQLINFRFNLKLAVPEDLTVFEEEANRRIDEFMASTNSSLDPLKVARPHQERELYKSEVHEALLAPRYRRQLAECDRLFSLLEQEHLKDVARFNAAIAAAQG